MTWIALTYTKDHPAQCGDLCAPSWIQSCCPCLRHVDEKVDAGSPDHAEQPPARMPGDAHVSAGNAQGAVAAAGGHMPDSHSAVAASGGEQGAVRGKRAATQFVGVAVSTACVVPSGIRQSRVVWSRLVVASRVPSGENAQSVTPPVWPTSTACSLPSETACR